jgi:DNA-binding NarL/FixJ family response regulator
MHCILIVDNDPFYSAGLRSFLNAHHFQVEEARDAQTALVVFNGARFEAAILDMRLPRASGEHPTHFAGINLARNLKALAPALGVVLISDRDNHSLEMADLIRDGIRGLAYQTKGLSPEAMLVALRESMAGEIWLDQNVITPRILKRDIISRLDAGEREWLLIAANNIPALSQREYEVGRLIAASYSVAGIAARLQLAERYVQNTITRIYQKLHLTDLPHEYKKDVLLAKAFLLHQLSE